MPRPKKSILKSIYAKRLGVNPRTVLRWIMENPDLQNDLMIAGWYISSPSWYWTPLQQEILDEYFK